MADAVTHTEKVITGEVAPVTHFEKVIAEYGGGGSATLIEKSITENGEYNASDDNADGYSSVTVAVSGGTNFSKMDVRCLLMGTGSSFLSRSTTYLNNDNSIDISNVVYGQTLVLLNPVDNLAIGKLVNPGDGYNISFVPTENCKVYEGETEIDLNEIFQSTSTPEGPTTYQPDGVKTHYLTGNKSPYAGVTRKLFDSGISTTFTIE